MRTKTEIDTYVICQKYKNTTLKAENKANTRRILSRYRENARFFQKKYYNVEYILHFQFLRGVSVPSSSPIILEIAVDRHNEKGVFVASQILLALHAIVETRGKSSSRIPWFHFEIAHIKGRIRFFFIVEKEYRGLLEGQLYAHYPNIEISEVSDIISPICAFCTARASLCSYSLDIIKLYTNLKDKTEKESVDPLSSLTSALSKTPRDDISLFHISFSPVPDSYWRTEEKIGILSSSLSD